VLSWRASVDDPALAHFGLKPHKLLIRAPASRSIDNSDFMRLQFGMIKFEQIGPANGVKQLAPCFTGRRSTFMPSPWRLI